MILTSIILKKGESKFGGLGRRQLEILGVKWPPKHGWKRKIIGRDYTKDRIERFLALKDKHLVNKKKFQDYFCAKALLFPDLTPEEKHLREMAGCTL